MKPGAFQKIYCRLTNITKATCTLEAEGVGYEEMAYVQGRAKGLKVYAMMQKLFSPEKRPCYL